MAVQFSQLSRWGLERNALVQKVPNGWRILKLRELLQQIDVRTRVKKDQEYRLCGVKWYGEGVFERETCLGSELSASQLYPLVEGRLIYNRLFAWKASFALVPAVCDGLFVSNEFPQFDVNENLALAEYVRLYCLSEAFIAAVKKASEGSAAVSRNRFKESSFLGFEIPLPPLETQRAIVAQWQKLQANAQYSEQEAQRRDKQGQHEFLEALGLQAPAALPQRRAFGMRWSEMGRWGSESNRLKQQGGAAVMHRFPIVQGTDCIESVSHGCSASPSALPTKLEVLKISAVTRGWLNTAEKKFAPDQSKLRQQYALRAGDVLLCRTNGTLDYVGRAALVELDHPDLIFPDKVIRVRLKDQILPAFFWYLLGTPYLRAQIESFARTAVGNYAIGGKDIWKFHFPLPPIDMQQTLITAIGQARADALALRQQAKQLREQAKREIEAALLGQVLLSI